MYLTTNIKQIFDHIAKNYDVGDVIGMGEGRPVKIVEINHDSGSIITCEVDGVDRAIYQLKENGNRRITADDVSFEIF